MPSGPVRPQPTPGARRTLTGSAIPHCPACGGLLATHLHGSEQVLIAAAIAVMGLWASGWVTADQLWWLVTGFALLAVGLFSGLVKASWLQAGTNWLMAEMLLFFVPAMLVVTEYGDLVRHQGLRILAVIIASTACVMVVTALAVDRVYRFELWLAHRRLCRSSHKE